MPTSLPRSKYGNIPDLIQVYPGYGIFQLNCMGYADISRVVGAVCSLVSSTLDVSLHH